MVNPTNRLAKVGEGESSEEETRNKNKQKEESIAEGSQQNKQIRVVDDELLLVVTTRINGHLVRALINSGATRCFVTPACIIAIGLKGVLKDIFLELGMARNICQGDLSHMSL